MDIRLPPLETWSCKCERTSGMEGDLSGGVGVLSYNWRGLSCVATRDVKYCSFQGTSLPLSLFQLVFPRIIFPFGAVGDAS